MALREVKRGPTEAATRGSRMSPWLSRPCRGARGLSVPADVGREKTSSTSMLNPPPPPVGRHLLYPSAPHRGAPDGCGRVGLGKEESSRTRRACGCGCPSSGFPPSWQWFGGLGSACSAVSGMRGCVTCLHACLAPRWACWSGA